MKPLGRGNLRMRFKKIINKGRPQEGESLDSNAGSVYSAEDRVGTNIWYKRWDSLRLTAQRGKTEEILYGW